MKDAITAKLIAQAAEYYETANTLLNGPLRGIFFIFMGRGEREVFFKNIVLIIFF
jgi:hypothetical protein